MDLEDLLLEAAGVLPTASGMSPPPRGQQQGSSSDDGSDSTDDETDKDSDKSDVGSDLYKNDYDREQLAEMSELDREMILSERAQRKDDQRLTEMVKAKQRGKKILPARETSPSLSSRLCLSVRSAEKEVVRNDALDKLRARRLKRKDPESRDATRGGYSVSKDYSPVRRTLTKAGNPGESDESGNHDQDEGSNRNEKTDDISEDKPVDKEVATYEDIKDIAIPRSKLEKWFVEPFFEELIVGCFVRVGIGRKGAKSYYRLCMVKNVDATPTNAPYELGRKRTHKYLNVAWASAERKWEMAVMSESPPTELEFEQWVDAMKDAGICLPTQQDVLEKREALRKANVLQENIFVPSRPLKMAVEKDHLRRDLEAAESQQDVAGIERIHARLQELEDISWEAMLKDSRGMKLEIMNRKNKFENFVNMFATKPVSIGLKAGETGYDPFSRRWTKSRNYYVPRGGNEAASSANEGANAESSEPGGSNSAEAGGTSEAGVVMTTTALKAAGDAGKLVDTSAPVDKGTLLNPLHNFELPISLTKLQMLEGPEAIQRALMARKQKIEATVGVKVPEDDGKEHPHAISIDEYRRRKGLQ